MTISFRKRFHEGLAGRDLLDAIEGAFQDVEEYVNRMINEKHAPIMVPRVTIDAAHATKNLGAGTAGGIWTAFAFEKTGSSTASTYSTMVDYTGRGVLTKFVVGEVTTGLTVVRALGARITIDGNVLYQDDTAALTRESQLRCLVGNLTDVSGTNLGLIDENPGLPFNSNCKLEVRSDGTRTTSAGWKIAKKL